MRSVFIMTELQYEPVQQKWWEGERPEVVETDKNVLKYYPKAKKLQASKPNWTNEYGEIRNGKTVILDLAEPTARLFVQNIVKYITE